MAAAVRGCYTAVRYAEAKNTGWQKYIHIL